MKADGVTDEAVRQPAVKIPLWKAKLPSGSLSLGCVRGVRGSVRGGVLY